MKFIQTGLVLSTALLLSACQTTGTQTSSSVSDRQMLSADMSCDEINAEFAELGSIITAAGDAQNNAAVTSTATHAATNAALYGGAASSIPFFGSIANAAGGVMNINAQNAQEEARKAEMRRAQLMGMAQAKGC